MSHNTSVLFSVYVTQFQLFEFKVIISTFRSLLIFPTVPTKGGSWSGSGSSWGPVELVAVIAGPVFLLCVLLMVGVFLFQYHQRAYSHRQRLEVEDPSCDHLYLAKDKTLQDLIYDMSTSGSGSGEYMPITSCDTLMEKNAICFGKHIFFISHVSFLLSRSSSKIVLCSFINIQMSDYSAATIVKMILT